MGERNEIISRWVTDAGLLVLFISFDQGEHKNKSRPPPLPSEINPRYAPACRDVCAAVQLGPVRPDGRVRGRLEHLGTGVGAR